MKCLRCKEEMKYMGKGDIEVGKKGFFISSHKEIPLHIFSCSYCGYIEFCWIPKEKSIDKDRLEYRGVAFDEERFE